MFPDLLILGPVTLHTYGLLTVLGWVSGVALMVRRRSIAGLERDQVMDLAFVMIVAAVLGARLLYVVVEWEHYRSHPAEILMIQKGGLVFYGGFLGACAAMAWRVRRMGAPLGRFADMTAPGLALGHAIGRVGCFLNGCCYGRTAESWAVHFPHLGDPEGVRRIPLQLWEAGFNAALAAFLAGLPARAWPAWRVFALYVGVYGAGRFGLEFLRDDPRGTVLQGSLSTSQAIAAVMVPAALVLWIWAGRKMGLGTPSRPSP